jgi:Raf kinase inhibitor-like YbhB/YbcL family protein
MRLLIAILVVAAGACSDGGVARPEHTGTVTGKETAMELTSSAFANEASIPIRYTCDGNDISPPLEISGIPSGTISLALVMDDPDAPVGVWDHWVVFNIEPRDSISEAIQDLGTAGNNSWGRTGYGGPCPPSGTHRYFFTVYALDTTLDLVAGAGKEDVLTASAGRVLAEATLMGRYGR